MNANALRAILLVKNVEEQDPDCAVLPQAEREAATREALRAHPAADETAERRQELSWQVLSTRAAILYGKLVERHPVVTRAVELESRLAGAAWAVLLAAFGLGLALSLLDSRVRIEILAFPLLGIVLWNVAVYALLGVAAVRGRALDPAAAAALAPDWFTWPARWSWRRAAALIRRSSYYHRPLAAALRRFSDDWWPIAQPLLLLQGKRLFHVAAAAAALGLVAGFYVRGVALEYRAGWESTFLGPPQVRTLLQVLYGPASVLTGIALPASDAEIAALHWRNGQGGGGAAPWIHLMAVTALLAVVLPRLLLAARSTWLFARAGRNLVPPESLHAYARQTLAASDAALPARTVRLTVYAHEPAAASGRGVQRLLRAAFGADTRLEFAPVVAYGDEAAYAREADVRVDLDVLLFSLASTPEVENHGAILQAARDRLARAAADARLLVLVDESPFLQRLGGDPSLAPRVEERRAAWRDFAGKYGLQACTIALATIPEQDGPAQDVVDRVRNSARGRVA